MTDDGIAEVRTLLSRLADHCERLLSEVEGLRKANDLLNAGLGSVCEGRDAMKLELRAAKARVAELEAALKLFADWYGRFGDDGIDVVAVAAYRRAAELLKGAGQ